MGGVGREHHRRRRRGPAAAGLLRSPPAAPQSSAKSPSPCPWAPVCSSLGLRWPWPPQSSPAGQTAVPRPAWWVARPSAPILSSRPHAAPGAYQPGIFTLLLLGALGEDRLREVARDLQHGAEIYWQLSAVSQRQVEWERRFPKAILISTPTIPVSTLFAISDHSHSPISKAPWPGGQAS